MMLQLMLWVMLWGSVSVGSNGGHYGTVEINMGGLGDYLLELMGSVNSLIAL